MEKKGDWEGLEEKRAKRARRGVFWEQGNQEKTTCREDMGMSAANKKESKKNYRASRWVVVKTKDCVGFFFFG